METMVTIAKNSNDEDFIKYALGFDYIMLSKEVVNSTYPHETVKLLQKLCNK